MNRVDIIKSPKNQVESRSPLRTKKSNQIRSDARIKTSSKTSSKNNLDLVGMRIGGKKDARRLDPDENVNFRTATFDINVPPANTDCIRLLVVAFCTWGDIYELSHKTFELIAEFGCEEFTSKSDSCKSAFIDIFLHFFDFLHEIINMHILRTTVIFMRQILDPDKSQQIRNQ